MSLPLNESILDARLRTNIAKPDPQRDSPRDAGRSSDHATPTPDAHIHSSIPLGIVVPSDGAPNMANEEMPDGLVPTTILWRGDGGKIVQLSGTFESSWSRRINMVQESVFATP
jgi:hypothetical protein